MFLGVWDLPTQIFCFSQPLPSGITPDVVQISDEVFPQVHDADFILGADQAVYRPAPLQD